MPAHVTSRLLTRDPIGMEGGINLYATVGNGLVMGEDSEGRVFIWYRSTRFWLHTVDG